MIIFIECKQNGNKENISTDKTFNKDKIINGSSYFKGKLLNYEVISSDEQEKYYEKRLNNQSFITVNKADYKKITGKIASKKYIIAVQAVYTNFGGNYVVEQNDDKEILVSHLTLGGGLDVKKSILLIETDELPSNVDVTWSSDL